MEEEVPTERMLPQLDVPTSEIMALRAEAMEIMERREEANKEFQLPGPALRGSQPEPEYVVHIQDHGIVPGSLERPLKRRRYDVAKYEACMCHYCTNVYNEWNDDEL